MADLVNIYPDTDLVDYKFWKENPQLKHMPGFKELYDRDKSEDKNKSSSEMVCIFVMCDPDESINKFYRLTEEERLDIVRTAYNKEFDPKDPIIKVAMGQYPMLVMSAVERSLKEEIDSMIKRSIVLRDTEYKLDKSQLHNGPKGPVMLTIKGTAKQLDDMRKVTSKLYEDYEQLKKKFLNQKSDPRVHGGRKQTASEKGLI